MDGYIKKKKTTKIVLVIIWKDNWEIYEQTHTSQHGCMKGKNVFN